MSTEVYKRQLVYDTGCGEVINIKRIISNDGEVAVVEDFNGLRYRVDDARVKYRDQMEERPTLKEIERGINQRMREDYGNGETTNSDTEGDD